MSVCQFCEKFSGVTGRNQPSGELKYEGKVKYGPRHYAHFECFLNHKTEADFKALGAFKIGQFPYQLLKERDYYEIAKAVTRAQAG